MEGTIQKLGRRRLIQPQSKEAESFLSMYLDPIFSTEQILDRLGIGLSTFYKYQRELQIPELKLGIGVAAPPLPNKLKYNQIRTSEEKEELELVRKLARISQIKINLIPIYNRNGVSTLTQVSNGNLDGAIGSICKTKLRASQFSFSQDYSVQSGAFGFLFYRSHYCNLKSTKRPTLGVVQNSVHEDYAIYNLSIEYNLRSFRDYFFLLQALSVGRIDFALFHPAWLEKIPEFSKQIEKIEKKINYQIPSGIIFNNKGDPFVSLINQSIEKILEKES
jgi:hypothetical protein